MIEFIRLFLKFVFFLLLFSPIALWIIAFSSGEYPSCYGNLCNSDHFLIGNISKNFETVKSISNETIANSYINIHRWHNMFILLAVIIWIFLKAANVKLFYKENAPLYKPSSFDIILILLVGFGVFHSYFRVVDPSWNSFILNLAPQNGVFSLLNSTIAFFSLKFSLFVLLEGPVSSLRGYDHAQ